MTKTILTLFIIHCSLFISVAPAKHLKIENVRIGKTDKMETMAEIICDISWDEAWNDSINNDGIWIFAKYKSPEGIWKHVELIFSSEKEFNGTDMAPQNFSKGDSYDSKELGIWVPKEKTGFFLFRTNGEGDINAKNVSFLWDISKDPGIVLSVSDIKVFGVEMVYVPEGPFWLGDPKGKDGPVNCYYTYPDKGAYHVTNAGEIIIDKKAGSLYCDIDNPRSRDSLLPFVIPKSFPNGYDAFWCMKYELSTQQYVDFLNTLTRKQQINRVVSDVSKDSVPNYYVFTDSQTEHYRHSIVCQKSGNGTGKPITFYTYAPQRAFGIVGWADQTAYADWAGLRPITEFEFTKSCRGPEKAIHLECAWGNTQLGRAQTFSGVDGSGYEVKVPTEGLVNCCFAGGIAPFNKKTQKEPVNPGFEGPVSIGLFSNSRHEGYSKRLNDGATYYGIMEMTGNLWEQLVTPAHSKGRIFKNIHGDGTIDENGFADVESWPGADRAGAGVRGGVWSSPEQIYLAIATRFAASFPRDTRGKNSGCRLGF